MTKPDQTAAQSIAYDVAAELRSLIRKMRRRMREQASDGPFGALTQAQISALHRLESDGPATVSALSRAEGVRPQSMSATIAALDAAGFVSGTPDPADKRQTIISLTELFKEQLAAGRAARQDWLSRALGLKLTEQEQAELARAVVLLKRVVDD